MTIRAAGTISAICLAAALAGCATNPLFEEPGDARFGDANRQTMMAQVIDPDPVYDTALVTSGEHAADAIQRYRDDAVKQPVREQTTQSDDSSSGRPQN